jgi:energy-coupling factor transport system ATP-binding protein
MKSKDIAIVGILLAIGAILRFFLAMLHTPLTPNMIIAFYCLAIILIRPKLLEALGIGLVAGALSMLISSSMFPPGNLISEPIGALVCFVLYAIAIKFSSMKSGIMQFKPQLSGIAIFCMIIFVFGYLSIITLPQYFPVAAGYFEIKMIIGIIMSAIFGYLTYNAVNTGSAIGPAFVTFLSTLASGFSFAAIAMIFVGASILSSPKYGGDIMAFVAVFVPIVVVTAVFNAIVVQFLYKPSSRVLLRGQE